MTRNPVRMDLAAFRIDEVQAVTAETRKPTFAERVFGQRVVTLPVNAPQPPKADPYAWHSPADLIDAARQASTERNA